MIANINSFDIFILHSEKLLDIVHVLRYYFFAVETEVYIIKHVSKDITCKKLFQISRNV